MGSKNNVSLATDILKKMALNDKKSRLLPPDFMSMLLDAIGGPRKLAGMVGDLLSSPSTSGQIRQRILTDVFRLMMHVEQKSQLPTDLSDTPTDELESLMVELMRRHNATKETGTTTTADQPGGRAAGPEPEPPAATVEAGTPAP